MHWTAVKMTILKEDEVTVDDNGAKDEKDISLLC